MPAGGAGEPVGALNDFTSTTRDFLIVIALLTPLQAAGEEYVFRGYLTQAFGSLLPWRRVSLVLAVLAPGGAVRARPRARPGRWPVFFDRFAFGVVAGILVIRTGGLEAAIAMHVLNNFFAYGTGPQLRGHDRGAQRDRAGSSPWMIVSTLTQSLVYLGARDLGRQGRWASSRHGTAGRGSPASCRDAIRSGGPVLDAPPPRV